MTTCAAEEWLGAEPPRGPVVVALSGGVDSSVALLLLREAGVECRALFMKNWGEPDASGACPWERDVADALAVCERLDVPLNTVDLSSAYREQVFADFLAGYAAGLTPNPDVLCNREIKFKAFLDTARALGASAIATGHYARRARGAARWRLLAGRDAAKDQTYFLYQLGQAQLADALFPLGALAKGEVRALARRAGLATHDKKDSTGICFIGEQPFRAFLGRFLAARPGPVLDEAGRVIGEHQGALYYTIGQRQGLGIGGVRGAAEAPWFVARKDVAANTLVAVQGHDHPALLSRFLWATDLHWVGGSPPALPAHLAARTRHRQPLQACTLAGLDDGTLEVHFAAPQRAVTPGQSVVFYDGLECLGGGVIARTA